MGSRLKGLLRGRTGWVLRILITVGLFVVLAFLVDLQEMVSYLREVLIGWLIAATAVKIVGIAAAILRWDLLLRAQGLRVPLTHLTGSFLVGRFIGMFFPSTLGLDTYRAVDIARHAKDAIGSVAAIVVEKVSGFFTLSLLVLFTLPWGRRFAPDTVLLVVGIAFCLPVVLAFLLLLRPGLFEGVLRWRFPGKARVEGKLREAVAAIGAYREQQGYLWMAVLLGLLVHGSTAWMYYFTARAVQVGVSVGDMLFVGPLIIVATLIGPVVAGLGAREGTAVALLERIGVAGGAAVLVGHLGFWTAEAIPAAVGALVLALRPSTYRPAIERARRPAVSARELPPVDAAATPLGPMPALWKDGLWPGLAAGTLAGLLVGIGEILYLALSRGAVADLGALSYGAVLYGAIGCLGGALLGLLCYFLARSLRPSVPALATSRWVFALLLLGMGGMVLRYRLLRDLFHEQVRTFSPQGLLLHAGLALGALILLIGVLFLARLVQRTRAGGWLARGGAWLIVLCLLIGAFLAASLATGTEPSPPAGSISPELRDRPNVILIVVDTLRADRLSCYGYDQPTSPSVDALAADGVLYRNMAAQSSWTRPSIATILTSLYPSSHTAVHKVDLLPEGALTVAEALQAAGYSTAGFADNINIAPSFGFDQGFDQYQFLEPSYPLGASSTASEMAFYQGLRRVYLQLAGERVTVQHYYQDAAVVNEAALAWLEAHQDERFFLFLHYMDPHDPYVEHPYSGYGYARARNQNPDAELAAEFSRLYDGEIRYLDQHLGELFDWLREAGLYEDALILFTADHGEEFQEHDGWWHGLTLYGEQIQVPLIVKYPGGQGAGTEVQSSVRSLDIAPTALDVAGLEIPPDWQGRSLRAEADPLAWVFAEEDHEGNILWSVQQGNMKLIVANAGNPRGLPEVALYDLASDPGERINLAEQQPERVQALRALLRQARVEALSHRVEAEAGSLDADTEELLRNLGY